MGYVVPDHPPLIPGQAVIQLSVPDQQQRVVGWEPHSGRKQHDLHTPSLAEPFEVVFCPGYVWCKLSAY